MVPDRFEHLRLLRGDVASEHSSDPADRVTLPAAAETVSVDYRLAQAGPLGGGERGEEGGIGKPGISQIVVQGGHSASTQA